MKKTLLIVALVSVFSICQAQDAAKLQKKAAAGDTKAMIDLAACYEAGHGVAVDSAKALDLYRRAAATGDADAKAALAYYYLWYSGIPRDEQAALRLAQESAAAGSARGMTRMAVHYQDAIGVPRNYRKAIDLLEQAAARGGNSAMAMLAWGYMYGDDSIDYDPDKALPYIKKIKESCSSSKFAAMATYCMLKNDPKTAYKWLQKGIALDNQRAAMNAARFRFYGWGCDEDEKGALADTKALMGKYGENNIDLMLLEFEIRSSARDSAVRDTVRALELLHKVGDCPNYPNYNELAVSYIYGNLTEIDSAKAEYYWRRGAMKGDTKSMMQLAIFKLNVGQTDSAMHYAMMAYERQDDDVCNFLARCYLYGRIDGREDHSLAKKYYLESARRGNPDDLVMAGKICLWNGDTVEAFRHFDRAIALGYNDAYVNKAYTYIESGNQKPGMALLEKGAKAGSSACLVSLGDEYVDMEQYAKAAKYYTKSQCAEGDYKLARLYLYGQMGDNDANAAEGVRLLRRSISGGNQDASMMLAECFKAGVGVDERPDSARIIYENLIKAGNSEAYMKLASYYDEMHDTAAVVSVLQRGVAAGDPTVMLIAGEKYIEGNYMPADTARGVELYRRAAKSDPNHLGVQVAFAEMYLMGLDTPKDTAAAMPYLRKAVDMGSAWAMAEMGDMYYYGRGGLERNTDSAMNYYYAASQQDNPRGDYMMGVYQEGRGNMEGALSFYASAARNGNRDAYIEVARELQNGNVVEANPEQAFQMAQQAAENWQHKEAYMLLGYAYLNGLGCQADTALALQYTRQAAEAGSTQAMMNLAAMYNAGVGVERDTTQILYWYERAVETGSMTATRRLANSYREGNGVPKNPKRAAELYQMAVDRGDLDAMCRLGLMYEEGEGVVLNSRKAFNLYSQAAERGSAWGMRLVGYCYAQGIYAQEDNEQAAKWFLQAAEAGDIQSCYIIGMFYSDGTGVKKNKKEAKKWLTIAAQNGHEGAAEALQSL
ncbi:MAG: sel1 repeat family protein [Bacteroidales bacterium]|nr:sel1 repeat family protein [Bacteroidales bacterium]